jgi:predicted ribosomally synthesized peptide with SipW-like signal peptide
MCKVSQPVHRGTGEELRGIFMNTSTVPTDRMASSATRTKRMRAILAGGLVLGVGAAVTLAAWSDSEFAQGTFAVGDFELLGSTDGVTFAAHDNVAGSPPASLGFTIDPDNIEPGEPVYAAFAVQLSEDSSYAASVGIAATSGTPGLADSLTYSLVSTPSFGCDAAAFAAGTELVADEATVDSEEPAIFTLTDVETPVYLCFAVTADQVTLTPGSSGTVVWEFPAESTTPLAP